MKLQYLDIDRNAKETQTNYVNFETPREVADDSMVSDISDSRSLGDNDPSLYIEDGKSEAQHQGINLVRNNNFSVGKVFMESKDFKCASSK